MASTRRRRPVRRTTKVEEVEEVEVEETDELEDDEEEEEEAPAPRRRVAKKVAVEEEDDDDDEEEEEEAPAPRRRRTPPVVKAPAPKESAKASPVKRAKKLSEDTVDVPEPEEPVVTFDGDDPLSYFASLLDAGQVLVISRVDKKTLTISKGGAGTAIPLASGGRKLSGREYWDTVLSPEFMAHNEEWGPLSYEEKVEAAKKLGVEWEPHKDPKVDVMRITAAIRDKLGIQKYKPEYDSRSARAAIRA